MRKKLFLKFLVVFLVAFIVSVVLQRIFQISLKDLETLVNSFGLLAPIAYSIILTLGLSVPFNPVSDYLTVNLAAFLFSPATAIIGTFVAHSLGLSINYWVASRFGWKILSRLVSHQEANYLADLAEKIKLSQIFWLRWLLPLTAVGIDFVSYAAGLASLNFVRFYLVSIIPWTVLNILFFSSTNFVIDRSTILFFIPGLIIVATPLAVLYLARKNIHTKGRDALLKVAKNLKPRTRG
ncbi:MAG: VTT domain-containing protein [Candidatus Woykebacteria bacterium]